jgi:hypothetical protein
VLLVFTALFALVFGSGCHTATVKLQSNKDAAAVRPIKRLYVVVDLTVPTTQQLAKNPKLRLKSDMLVASLMNSLTNTPLKIEYGAASPLQLNANYDVNIANFYADAVLLVKINNCVIDNFGGCWKVFYQADLYDEITHKTVWRAFIDCHGDPVTVDEGMQKMANAVVKQLRADGFIESKQAGSAN